LNWNLQPFTEPVKGVKPPWNFTLQDLRQGLIVHAAINAGVAHAPTGAVHGRYNPHNVNFGGYHVRFNGESACVFGSLITHSR
jgi:hypothetical protein